MNPVNDSYESDLDISNFSKLALLYSFSITYLLCLVRLSSFNLIALKCQELGSIIKTYVRFYKNFKEEEKNDIDSYSLSGITLVFNGSADELKKFKIWLTSKNHDTVD